MKWFSLALVVVAAVLYFSNPTIDEFRQFISSKAQQLVNERAGTSGLGELLAEGAAHMAETHVERVTERDDYYLFSTYTIDLTPTSLTNRAWHFVGIGGMFFDLSRFYDAQ